MPKRSTEERLKRVEESLRSLQFIAECQGQWMGEYDYRVQRIEKKLKVKHGN